MGLFSWFFGKKSSKKPSSSYGGAIKVPGSFPLKMPNSARIPELMDQVFAFAVGKEQNEKKTAICSELLLVLDEASNSRDKALVLTLRAAACKELEQYDSALQDLSDAGEVARKHGHRDLLSEVERRLPEVQALIEQTKGTAPSLEDKMRALPILSQDFDNWKVRDRERNDWIPAWDASQIIKKNKGLSGITTAALLGEDEWDIREFSTVSSNAAQAQVPVEKIVCLCRYRFDGPRREITRIFRYGEDKFAYIVEVS